jgi:hypothetical protein
VPSNPCDLLEFSEAALVAVEPGRGATSGLLEISEAMLEVVEGLSHGIPLPVARVAMQVLHRARPLNRIR